MCFSFVFLHVQCILDFPASTLLCVLADSGFGSPLSLIFRYSDFCLYFDYDFCLALIKPLFHFHHCVHLGPSLSPSTHTHNISTVCRWAQPPISTNRRSEDSFAQYFSEMPWVAVPYTDEGRRSRLNRLYGIQGVFSLDPWRKERHRVQLLSWEEINSLLCSVVLYYTGVYGHAKCL